MKKALKITGIVFAVLIVLAVYIYFFTGIPSYLALKKYYPHTDELQYTDWPYYDTGTLKECRTISYDRLYADLPLNMENSTDNQGNIIEHRYTNKNNMENGTKKCSVTFHLRYSWTEAAQEKQSGLSEKEKKRDEKARKNHDKQIEKYCRSIGRDVPGNYFEYYDLAYSVDLDDHRILSRQQENLHVQMIMIKSMARSTTETVYRFETDTGMGFVEQIGNQNIFSVYLYEKNDPDAYHELTIYAPDEETAYKIINSLRINYTPEQEE